MSAACPLFGFVLRVTTKDANARKHLLAALCAELLAQRGLLLAEGELTNVYVITGDGFQATDSDREAVIAWLAAHAAVGTYTVGTLDDVGHAA